MQRAGRRLLLVRIFIFMNYSFISKKSSSLALSSFLTTALSPGPRVSKSTRKRVAVHFNGGEGRDNDQETPVLDSPYKSRRRKKNQDNKAEAVIGLRSVSQLVIY